MALADRSPYTLPWADLLVTSATVQWEHPGRVVIESPYSGRVAAIVDRTWGRLTGSITFELAVAGAEDPAPGYEVEAFLAQTLTAGSKWILPLEQIGRASVPAPAQPVIATALHTRATGERYYDAAAVPSTWKAGLLALAQRTGRSDAYCAITARTGTTVTVVPNTVTLAVGDRLVPIPAAGLTVRMRDFGQGVPTPRDPNDWSPITLDFVGEP